MCLGSYVAVVESTRSDVPAVDQTAAGGPVSVSDEVPSTKVDLHKVRNVRTFKSKFWEGAGPLKNNLQSHLH